MENEDYCSDIPCTDYYFFEIPIKSGPLTVREARRKFIDFFYELSPSLPNGEGS